VSARVGFEMRGVGQPVSPLEPVLAHYPNDAPAFRREAFVAARSRRYSGHIDGEASFMQ